MSATIQISREELYRKVWSTPAIRLAKEFGISDVALNKTCKRMGVPRPERGHWARIAAGHKPAQTALPPLQDGQPETAKFNVTENLKRRAAWQKPSQPNADDDSAVAEECPIRLSSLDGDLHPLAIRAQSVLQKTKAGSDGRIEIRLNELPSIRISSALTDRLAVALDAAYRALESRGITLRVEEGGWKPGLRIVKGPDWLRLSIEEPLLRIKREPSVEDKLRPSSTWQLSSIQLSGRLAFILEGPWPLTGQKRWSETKWKSLEEVIFSVVLWVQQLFESYEVERERKEEEERKREEERKELARQLAEDERQREEKRKLREHEETLMNIRKTRAQNLWRATEWWKIHQECLLFIKECERHWKNESGGNLAQDQLSWLAWARECAESMSPFSEGYPNPALDGAFDASVIIMGDAYPKTRDIPNPVVDEQAMKERGAAPETKNKPTAPPVQMHQTPPSNVYHPPAPKPYPFWLLHRRR